MSSEEDQSLQEESFFEKKQQKWRFFPQKTLMLVDPKTIHTNLIQSTQGEVSCGLN